MDEHTDFRLVKRKKNSTCFLSDCTKNVNLLGADVHCVFIKK